MAIFDTLKCFTVRLSTELGPRGSFHINRPFVERTPPRSLHDHEFYECFWLAMGSCRHYINGKTEHLASGTLTFIRPHDCHAFQNVDDSRCQMVNIAFSAETADHLLHRYPDELAGRFFWAGGQMPEALPMDSARLHDLGRLVQTLDRGSRSLAQIEVFLLTLMTGVLADRDNLPNGAPFWLSKACRQIREPDALRGGVSELVALTGKSHEHVSRTFRRLFGMTPSGYVNAVRMEFAAGQLAGTELPIMDIAFECGIDDLSHFYRLFRQVHGMSPMRYRRRSQLDLVHPQA